MSTGWDDAFAEIARRLPPLLERYGRDSVGVYLGNPNVHDHAPMIYSAALTRALGTGYRFTASTVDQMPKSVASGLMFGHGLTVAIPDVTAAGGAADPVGESGARPAADRRGRGQAR